MKKRISLSLEFLVTALSLTHICYSQDIIVLKNGDEIKSKVLEVSSDQIKYKKWENVDGPTYSSTKSEVFMIKYKNGSKDIFNNTSESKPKENNPEAAAINVAQEYLRKVINNNSNQILGLTSFN